MFLSFFRSNDKKILKEIRLFSVDRFFFQIKTGKIRFNQMSTSVHHVEIRPTKPFTDQKPGTSGLRKPTKTFKSNQYFENFIQAYFDDLAETNKDKQPTLVVGGDGRHFVREATRIIIQMAAANNVKKLFIARDGLMSTPSVSCVIRKRATDGGIVLTASHNPGGIDNDFGVKFNISNGGSTKKIDRISF